MTASPAARVDPRAAAMTEAELEEQIRKLCEDLHVFRYHLPDSRRVDAGFPDDVLIGPGGVLFRECKTEKGTLRAAQRLVIGLLEAAGADVKVWRPSDLYSGTIQREIIGVSALKQASLRQPQEPTRVR